VTEIGAALVKELRDSTGAGMMACKQALVDTGGDIEAARKLLREKGMAQAGKRAGRETTEGRVLARIDGPIATIVGVGCETEPVSKNDEFLAFAQKALDEVAAHGEGAVAALDAEKVELIAKIGENIAIRESHRLEASDGEVLAAYVHPPAQKIGVVVKLRGGSPELARQVAMHISFAAPRYLGRGEIAPEVVEAERDIYLKQSDVASKPEEVRSKIVEGMLTKRFFADAVLVDQPWIHDPATSVGKALAADGAEVVAFERVALGD
jgi:elongation factor Ts